ncbi:methyltransferase domain-containing protein [Pseudonocardia broussonetiae]|uniref:Methyltransferase domain-containing protein n=1 Tax=Pseudonocardia broussonetiae TaxID=2736640 RepID=A0A6M6JH13_9PSEU|nr:methyltransferase domain-containing protein [Pseudonocardia broussonetiae]QJY45681.1 methyltransferase domain-containing protein [Pseudonocardia broussonetiae]
MSEGPRGWAAPLYARVLDATGVAAGTRVLDLGSGGGGFAAAAVARGAVVHGIDTDPSAVAVASGEVPDAVFAVGDAHDLGSLGPFDVAAAVQLLAHVVNPVLVLREAARVAPVVAVTVWGREEECDVRAFGEALAPWVGSRRAPDGPPPITEPARLRALVELAGLTVTSFDEVVCPFDYPDDDELVGPLFGTGIGRHAVNRGGPVAVRDAVLERFERHRTPGGGYRLENVFRVLTATSGGATRDGAPA